MASRRRAERAACMAPVSSSAALPQGDASETAWKGNADPKQSSDGAYYAALNRQALTWLPMVLAPILPEWPLVGAVACA